MRALGFLAVMVLAAEHVASPQFAEDVTVTALSVPIRLQGLRRTRFQERMLWRCGWPGFRHKSSRWSRCLELGRGLLLLLP